MSRVKGQFYAPEEYLANIDEDSIEPDAGFVGLIKPADDKGLLLYAHPMSCQTWIEINLELVETIEHLGQRRCDDHSHPLVRLHFKTFDTLHHKTMLSLARLHHDNFAPAALPGVLDNGCPPGQHPCFDAGLQKWICCSD